MEALLVLVTDGIVERPRRKSPWRRHAASVGMSLFSRYSRPNPSHMITTARCGGRCANAGPERSAALEARNSRRESEEALIVFSLASSDRSSTSLRRGFYSIEKLHQHYEKMTSSAH